MFRGVAGVRSWPDVWSVSPWRHELYRQGPRRRQEASRLLTRSVLGVRSSHFPAHAHTGVHTHAHARTHWAGLWGLARSTGIDGPPWPAAPTSVRAFIALSSLSQAASMRLLWTWIWGQHLGAARSRLLASSLRACTLACPRPRTSSLKALNLPSSTCQGGSPGHSGAGARGSRSSQRAWHTV